jgi:hypothetical protein
MHMIPYMAPDQGNRIRKGGVRFGVPVGLEQKTTILWKYWYLRAYLKGSPC